MSQNDRCYNNLWKGDLVLEDSKSFNNRHLLNKQLIENLFDKFYIRIVSKEPIGSDNVLYTVVINDRVIEIATGSFKHSGLDDEKVRYYVYPSLIKAHKNTGKDYPLIMLSGNYVGDDTILVFSKFNSFVNSSSIEKSYSAYWLCDYKKIVDTYNSDNYILWKKIRNSNIHHFKGIKYSVLSNFDYEQFVKFIESCIAHEDKQLAILPKKKIINYDMEPEDFDNKIYNNCTNELPRNNEYKYLAFERANYKCELCGKTTTFEVKDGNQYFEGHHLIMYNAKSQKRYKKSLDFPKNIVCLCPECHKKIHFAQNQQIKELIIKLFKKKDHAELLEMFNLEDNFIDVLNDYFEKKKGE